MPQGAGYSPVIHWLSPVDVAIRPSKDVAALTVTMGLPFETLLKNPSAACAASVSRTPSTTSIPASLSSEIPPPSTRGSGSLTPTTTRSTPATINASAQGGFLRDGHKVRV